MPCLILTGGPCVGKSTFATKLGERAMRHKSGMIRRIEIVNEESACPDNTMAECYQDSHAEKKTRGALKAEFDRKVAEASSKKDTLIILDSMNYIKGFRYELHCISKAAGERHGVVWVLNDANVAKEWNRSRKEGFSDQVMDELALRYEPPDARNRWDKPLYRINVTPNSRTAPSSDDTAQAALQKSVYNMHSLSDAINNEASSTSTANKSAASSFKRAGFRRASPKQQQTPNTQQVIHNTVPAEDSLDSDPQISTESTKEPAKEPSLEARIDEMLDSFLLDVQPLKEGLSTRQHTSANANVLHEVDSITQQVCNSIASAQKMPSVIGGRLVIPVAGGKEEGVSMQARRTTSLAELKRLRRQYIHWVASHPPEDTTERGIVTSFVAYIEAQT